MRLLLDTHVLLWALSEPDRLSDAARTAVVDPDNEVLASVVSAWEIAIKQSLGKIALPGPAEAWLPVAAAATGIEWLPVQLEDALRVQCLPWHHRDPFDRLLVAQARAGTTFVTHDRRLEPYGVAVLWN
jgi:PIN domain nuclease of toxin-antitoxin system